MTAEAMQALVDAKPVGAHRVHVVSARAQCPDCAHGVKAPGFARNIGMRLASAGAHFVAFQDDDDLMTENRLFVQVRDLLRTKAKLGFAEAYALQPSERYRGRFTPRGFVALNATQAEAKEYGFRYVVRDVTMRHMARFHDWDESKELPRHVPLALLRAHNVIITSTVLANLTYLRTKRLEFDPGLVAGDEDVDMWTRIGELCRCPIRFFPLPLAFLDLYEHGRQRQPKQR